MTKKYHSINYNGKIVTLTRTSYKHLKITWDELTLKKDDSEYLYEMFKLNNGVLEDCSNLNT